LLAVKFDLSTALLWAGPVVAVCALTLAIIAFKRLLGLRRQLDELRRESQRQNTTLLALHGAMKMIADDVIVHGQVQSSVKRTLDHLVDQHTELQLRDVDEGLYPQAIQMIRKGRPREEVRQLCGLTESEVDLLFSLHGQGIATKDDFVPERRR
jgi:hypothetical protein